MQSNRSLIAALTGIVSADYFKLDEEVPGTTGVEENIKYGDHRVNYQNGSGNNNVNLLYDERNTLQPNSAKLYGLNGGLTNKWDDILLYNSIKLLLIHNRNEFDFNDDSVLVVTFGHERYDIGPQGTVIRTEPIGAGMFSNLGAGLSSSTDQPTLTITNPANYNNNAITYDVIIIGSDQQESSSSSGV